MRSISPIEYPPQAKLPEIQNISIINPSSHCYDSGQDNNENWDYIDNGDGSGSDSEGDYTEDTSDQDIEYYE